MSCRRQRWLWPVALCVVLAMAWHAGAGDADVPAPLAPIVPVESLWAEWEVEYVPVGKDLLRTLPTPTAILMPSFSDASADSGDASADIAGDHPTEVKPSEPKFEHRVHVRMTILRIYEGRMDVRVDTDMDGHQRSATLNGEVLGDWSGTLMMEPVDANVTEIADVEAIMGREFKTRIRTWKTDGKAEPDLILEDSPDFRWGPISLRAQGLYMHLAGFGTDSKISFPITSRNR